jgi:hypothetical protein
MPRSPDTAPDAEAKQFEVLRRMTPPRRTAMAEQMSLDMRATALAGIRKRHPEYDDATARWALFRLLVGDELFKKVWPHAPFVAPPPIDVERFYVDADVARDALRRRSMFNVIDMTTAWKVDLVIRKNRAFSIEELQRRSIETIVGVDAPTATAEDTIIAKLEWAKAGSSERQLRDVAGIRLHRALGRRARPARRVGRGARDDRVVVSADYESVLDGSRSACSIDARRN